MLKQLAVQDLTPGMMVTQVIRQSGPVKIRKVGFIRSPDMIKGLLEMGVEEVEVDLAQSLGIEEEQQEQDDSPTATQRLVASNKQISDADRQLSQQFHRSLFLPAVEQMPSKWSLYGKPYSIVLGLLLLGLTIGWFLVTVPMTYFNTQQDALTHNAVVENAADENANKQMINNAEELVSNEEELSATNNNQATDPDNTLAGVASDTGVSSQEEMTQTQSGRVLDKEIANGTDKISSNVAAPSEARANSSSEDDTSDKQLNTFQGVVLEDGQQVLGYQAPTNSSAGQDQNSSADPASMDQPSMDQLSMDQASRGENTVEQGESAANSGLNSQSGNNLSDDELMRRLQQAIQEVDSLEEQAAQSDQDSNTQANEQGDLSDVPRIDQLSAAILTQMPAMSFSAHMYSSSKQDRWVRVNGLRLGEGESIGDGVMLKSIEPEQVVLEFRGQAFTMNALSDW